MFILVVRLCRALLAAVGVQLRNVTTIMLTRKYLITQADCHSYRQRLMRASDSQLLLSPVGLGREFVM